MKDWKRYYKMKYPTPTCEHCGHKGACSHIEENTSLMFPFPTPCPIFEVYSREERYPNKNKADKQWLLTGVMLDEDIRIDKDELVYDLYMTYFRDSGYQHLDLYKEALSCILGNLVVNGNRNKPLSKPLESSSKGHPKWFKQIVVDNIFKCLVGLKYCLCWKGYPGQATKYFITIELIEKRFNIKTSKPRKYILLNKIDPTDKRRISRSKKRKLYIPTPYCSKLIRMTDDINFINKLLGGAVIKFTYDNEIHKRESYVDQLNLLVNCKYLFKEGNQFEINKDSLYLFRVFNRGGDRYQFGGRFYTKIFQGIPQNVRPSVTIDGYPTIELDFSAHHLRILYHKEGIDFQGEVYIYAKSDTPNKDKRLIHKKIAMIAINAETRRSAILAVRNALIEEKKVGKFNSEIPTDNQLNVLYDGFLNHHKPIAKYVGADAGIQLQRIDSDIMNEILVQLTKLKIVGLPIHDSVIVQIKHQEKLKELMIKYYKKLLKFNPIIE